MTTTASPDTRAPKTTTRQAKLRLLEAASWPFRKTWTWGRAVLINQRKYKGYRFGREMVVIGLLVFGGNLAAQRLSFSLTDSVDAKLLVRNEAPLVRDDFVSFFLFDGRAPNGQARVMKRMIGLPGDELRYEPQERMFYVNDVAVGYVKPKGLDGSSLAAFPWDGTHIPNGFAYVGGGHKDSYDSRYFGLVSLDRLTRYDKLF